MRRLSVLIVGILALASGQLYAQVLTEWVETRAPQESNKIALGYPVPIPVDTPLPFDGFRTYAGLHTRHQDLAANTPFVHPEQVGLTRHGRTIWAYRLGDADLLTIDGLPESAALTNGGIHAREWQSPETVTGILELFALHEEDNHFYDYLRDNVNMIVIPSLNIDGFMQTQRYPSLNYMMSDPDSPTFSPRDGRMRRKNMLSADEDLYTTFDHLNGVDLNRNNAPFWASDPNHSSSDLASIVHHGASRASEPEIQAMDAAAHLGPIDRLRMFTDVHSFSLVHFWARSNNYRLAVQTERVLRTFTNHHVQFPAGKHYYYASVNTTARNRGIGTAAEYFTYTYEVPSWTLEIEPSNGQAFHAPLPGSGADYGGLSENGHDGFILPESEIRRVREELAQSFAAAYYHQAGPPSIQSMRILDTDTLAVVFDAEWDVESNETRLLHTNRIQPLQLDHSYELWLSFNKPMRWREDGQVVPFPGQPESGLDVEADLSVNNSDLNVVVAAAEWLNQPGEAPNGYQNYQDDAFRISFSLPLNTNNGDIVTDEVEANLTLRTSDMTGMITDANPATVADWTDGAWTRYENGFGNESDTGGHDKTISFPVTSQALPPPFTLEPGITSAWGDPLHDGEGFLLEMLANNVAVMFWFTYDSEGAQDWYIAKGEARGNRIFFPDLYRVSGGEFGPDVDPVKITEVDIGSASFIFTGCDRGDMSYQIGPHKGRMQLFRITNLMGINCGQPIMRPVREEALLSGSWFDPTRSGEGFNIEVLIDGRVVVFWFSYDPEGNRRWFFGLGEFRDGKMVFDDMQTTSGGIFGPEFDPTTVEYEHWGSLELDLNCNSGTATYSSTEEGFGSGTMNVNRLTHIDSFGCP